MSAPVDRMDLGFVSFAAGLAWQFDQPGYLVGVGIGLIVFAPLGEALGAALGRRTAAALRRRRSDDVVKLP